jgi:hypothetical protein
MIVAISCHTHQRLELTYFLCKLHPSAEVSRMPDLIHRLEKLTELIVKNAMSI